MSFPDNFNITSLQSYERLKQISELNPAATNPIASVAKWAKSVAAAAFIPSSSPIRVAAKQMDQLVDDKLATFNNKVAYDNTEVQILSLKTRLHELDIMKVNLTTHNKIINEYNSRFIAKDSSIAACPQHEEMLAKIDMNRKPIQDSLDKLCMKYSDTILDQIMSEIEKGMPVDRDFMRDQYPELVKKFDILPDKTKVSALNNLNEILNKAYIAHLHSKLMNDFQSVIPKTMDALLAKFGLEHLLSKENAQESIRILSDELQAQMNRGDLGSIDLPDYIDLIQSKFLFQLATLIKSKISDFEQLDATINLIQKLIELEQECVKAWKAASEGISSESIQASVLAAQDKIYAESPDAYQEVITNQGMKRIESRVRKQFAQKRAIDQMRGVHAAMDLEMLLAPDYTERLRQVMLDELQIRKAFEELIHSTTKDYLFRLSRWATKNLKYSNFDFNQSEKSSQFVLGSGCCWSISLEWCRRLMQIGKEPITSYANFMPDSPPDLENISDLDLKPTMKKFMEELKQGMAESLVTPRMRREQAQSELEARMGKTDFFKTRSQDQAAPKFGFDTESLLSFSGTPEEFLTEFVTVEEWKFKNHHPSHLNETSGVVGFHANSPSGGHAMVIQIDFANKIFRLGDPNTGMWTFPNKESFLHEAPLYIEALYPDFDRFKCIAYIPLKR